MSTSETQTETALAELIQRFGASIGFDQQMAFEDITGSLAHAAMLTKIGVLSAEEGRTLRQGLQQLGKKLHAGTLAFELRHEDVHMNMEHALAAEIGAVAGKLHTGRSRNDQVATDMRLYLRTRVCEIAARLCALQRVLQNLAAQHLDTVLPGYTHLQRAQPILLAHHLLAYGWMFARDADRLRDSWKRLNRLPLGAGALAGTSFALDREYVAELLAFDGLCENSMDAVSDRDFIVEFLADAALCAAHLSRLSEELILWSSAEFGYVEVAKPFCTGSSIMPQKRNPDMAELGRGKAGRVYGALIGMLTVLKGLPLTYNKDMQEDKEGMFDAAHTLLDTLAVFTPMVESLTFRTERMRQAADQSYANATDLADYLAKHGVPFREAHGIVKRLVEHGIESGKGLEQFSIQELQSFSPAINGDVYAILDTATVVAARRSRGGTARSEVEAQIARFQEQLVGLEAWQRESAERLRRAQHSLWEDDL